MVGALEEKFPTPNDKLTKLLIRTYSCQVRAMVKRNTRSIFKNQFIVHLYTSSKYFEKLNLKNYLQYNIYTIINNISLSLKN